MTNFRLFETERVLQTTILDMIKIVESVQKGKKTMWKGEIVPRAICPSPTVF